MFNQERARTSGCITVGHVNDARLIQAIFLVAVQHRLYYGTYIGTRRLLFSTTLVGQTEVPAYRE